MKTRHHVFQIMHLKPGELEWLGQHLGHTVQIHKENYRLHDSTIEMAKISKLLIALDSGQVNKIQGKSLEQINLEG